MAYFKHVPPLIKTIYLAPFEYFPKIAPKHQFINLVRTMNSDTHEYLGQEYTFNNIKGWLYGEFTKKDQKPDGRIIFRAQD